MNFIRIERNNKERLINPGKISHAEYVVIGEEQSLTLHFTPEKLCVYGDEAVSVWDILLDFRDFQRKNKQDESKQDIGI